jgi:hypothetical protein
MYTGIKSAIFTSFEASQNPDMFSYIGFYPLYHTQSSADFMLLGGVCASNLEGRRPELLLPDDRGTDCLSDLNGSLYWPATQG